MKLCINCKENKELADFGKDKSRKDQLNVYCNFCLKISRLKNRDKINIRNKIYTDSHKKEKAEYDANYRIENRGKIDLYEQNRKEKKSKYNSVYAKQKPGKMNAKNMKRQAAKIKATPKWLTKEQIIEIEQLYIEAARLTRETGIKHHVDHILPLQGKDVRGLHVPWNLQILTAADNISKGNRVVNV